MKHVKSNRVYAQVVDGDGEGDMEAPMSSNGDMTLMSMDDDDRVEGVNDNQSRGEYKRITSHVLDYDDEGLG